MQMTCCRFFSLKNGISFRMAFKSQLLYLYICVYCTLFIIIIIWCMLRNAEIELKPKCHFTSFSFFSWPPNEMAINFLVRWRKTFSFARRLISIWITAHCHFGSMCLWCVWCANHKFPDLLTSFPFIQKCSYKVISDDALMHLIMCSFTLIYIGMLNVDTYRHT